MYVEPLKVVALLYARDRSWVVVVGGPFFEKSLDVRLAPCKKGPCFWSRAALANSFFGSAPRDFGGFVLVVSGLLVCL